MDKRAQLHLKARALSFALVITAIVFLVWDVWFTDLGVWSFNPEFISGIKIFMLPIEEWMFFFTIPFSCMFIHEVLKFYYPNVKSEIIEEYFPWIILLVGLVMSLVYIEHIYTQVTFTLLVLYVLFSKYVIKFKNYTRFLLTYLFCLPPFYLVNGILTAFPVVIYNNSENLGIRIGTVPLDDHFYLMLLLLMNISLFEWYINKQFKKNQ